MIQKIGGRLIFVYGSAPKQHIKTNFKLSLLGILLGIFLLPNLAYLSAITPEEIIALTNQARQTAGLNALTANQLLTQAAIAKGKAILESQAFKHNINDRKFSSWIRDTGYNYSYVGENLAIDFETSQSVIDAWKNSPMHKKNLLSPYYREIGLAAVQGKFQGQDTTVVVQIFGSPAVGSAKPLASGSEFNSANSNINFLENNLAGYELNRAENLLTHSIINQEILPPYNSKLIIPAENNLGARVNKLIAQPGAYAAANNFFIIFSSLTLIYLFIFLYYYYFFKINKLSSI
ncbi:MAG: CAP domain-containing protein [Patescibacteria group bacterium]|nr:CAP domain-containing protein [Patescibacteria group bacterium]